MKKAKSKNTSIACLGELVLFGRKGFCAVNPLWVSSTQAEQW